MKALAAFVSVEGHVGVGDEFEVGDAERANDLVRWGLAIPADLVVPKSVPDAGKERPSLSSGPVDPPSPSEPSFLDWLREPGS